jgi:hypothetical protein
MTRRWVAVGCVVAALVVGACGNPEIQPAAEVADEAASAVTIEPATTTMTESSITASSETEPETASTTDPGEPSTVDAHEGVAIDDPFPPQADGATDPAIADNAIRWAFRHWILIELDPATRARIVEDGEQNTVTLEAGIEAARGTIDGAGIAVDEVRLTGVEQAEVVFRARWQGGPSPIFPDPILGTAVFQNGTWRISGRTLCLLAFVIGQSCSSDTALLAPAAFRAHEIPDGFRWVLEPEFDGVMPVPGGGYWMASEEMVDRQPSAPGLSISFQILPGSASLTDADIEVIARSRGGLGSSVPIEIDDARGWMDAQPGFTNITLVRPDDVVVLAGGQVSSTELMTILGELEPIALPSDYPMVDPGEVPITDGISFEL